MADTSNLTNFLQDVADAIKEKKDYPASQKISAADFDTEIAAIDTIKGEQVTINPSTTQQVVTPSTGKNAITQVTVPAVTSSIDANIIQANIKAGVTILGVEGNLESDKPDQTKTVTPSTTQQVVTPDTGYELASVTVNAVTSDIDADIVAGNIKKDVNILGVTGTYEGTQINNQNKTVNPTTSQQVVGYDTGYTGLGQVIINAVTSSIDSNIRAENIRKDVNILGVTGTHEGGIDTSIADIVASDVRQNKIAIGAGNTVIRGVAEMPRIVRNTNTSSFSIEQLSIPSDRTRFAYWRQDDITNQGFTIDETYLYFQDVTNSISRSIRLEHSNPTNISVGCKNVFETNSCVICLTYFDTTNNVNQYIDFYLYNFTTNTFTFKYSNSSIANLPMYTPAYYYIRVALNPYKNICSIPCLKTALVLRINNDFTLEYANSVDVKQSSGDSSIYMVKMNSKYLMQLIRYSNYSNLKSGQMYTLISYFVNINESNVMKKVLLQSVVDISIEGTHLLYYNNNGSVQILRLSYDNDGTYLSRSVEKTITNNASNFLEAYSGFINDDIVCSRDSTTSTAMYKYYFAQYVNGQWVDIPTVNKCREVVYRTTMTPYQLLSDDSSSATTFYAPIFTGAQITEKINHNEKWYVDTSDANATAGKILEGYTAYVNGEKLEGEMMDLCDSQLAVDMNNVIYNPSFSNLITFTSNISSDDIGDEIVGVNAETTTVLSIEDTELVNIDPNISPENIKKDVTILGITGTYEDSTEFAVPDGMKFAQSTLTTISNLDTSNVTDMSNMFINCHNLATVSNLDTSNVTNMTNMFTWCSNLTAVPDYNTSKVTNMYGIFTWCSNLTTVPSFDTSNVTNMLHMFANCRNLTAVPNYNTSKVIGMTSMFAWCSNLTSIPNYDTSNVTDMRGMFYHCDHLVTVPEFNTSNVTDMTDMFANCNNLTTVSEFNTSKTKNINSMFGYCNNLSIASIQNVINMCLNSNITSASYKNLSNANTYSPFYKSNITNSKYSNRLSELSAAGWTY